MKKSSKKELRWGYTTGACVAALASTAWLHLQNPSTYLTAIPLLFLDGRERRIPLLPMIEKPSGLMVSLKKDGGDDPDCTHGAIFFGTMRASQLCEARLEDYVLPIGEGVVIVRAIEGIGICTRLGLDCDQGKWAITKGPREMIAENLHRLDLHDGCWLFEFGVERGVERAKHTLNSQLGIIGGISILGTTGLVRPYSHDAYIATIRICVQSHHISKGTSMVFCTGGRTKSGAQRHLPALPDTAFACIGDFIAESLVTACQYGMKEIIVACMAGKLCKYAAGFANTHAHKVPQDMERLIGEVKKYLPDATRLHEALADRVSVREALLSIPENDRLPILRKLAETALTQFARHCGNAPSLRILVFDFDGTLLFEEALPQTSKNMTDIADMTELSELANHTDNSGKTVPIAPPIAPLEAKDIGEDYFMVRSKK